MTAWLVLGRGMVDDVPMRLFATREMALDYARTVTVQDVRDHADSVLGLEITDVVAISLVGFLDGEPSLCEDVSSLLDELTAEVEGGAQ